MGFFVWAVSFRQQPVDRQGISSRRERAFPSFQEGGRGKGRRIISMKPASDAANLNSVKTEVLCHGIYISPGEISGQPSVEKSDFHDSLSYFIIHIYGTVY
jgi:hypothetical protein